jgi:hypothetical protein
MYAKPKGAKPVSASSFEESYCAESPEIVAAGA